MAAESVVFEGFLKEKEGEREEGEDFLAREARCSLFLLNGATEYLKENKAKVIEKMARWPSLLNCTEAEYDKAKEVLSGDFYDKSTERIMQNDVERTFTSDSSRKRLHRFLMKLRGHTGDYAQSMSYVSATLLLSLPEHTVFSIMATLDSDAAYLPGHWKHEAHGFVRDAYISYELLEKENGEVVDHLRRHYIVPNMVFQKYYQGLGLHLFPFEAALQYLEEFLTHGVVFLWHFTLCLFHSLKSTLLSLTEIDKILAVLRLEKDHLNRLGIPHSAEHYLSLIEKAARMTLLGDIRHYTFDLSLTRENAFTKHVKPLLEPKKKENDGEGEGEEEEEGDDCQICKENFPDFWCEDCVRFICETCHENQDGSHDDTHGVTPNEEMEEEEIDQNWTRARKSAKSTPKNVDSLVDTLENLKV